jgi:hypothetical protein
MSREQNTRRRVKRRAEVTQEERIQDREINAAHQKVSRKRLELRFVGTAFGELEVFQEEAQLHQVPPVEEICQFFQAVKWKGETLNSCCPSGEVFAPLADPPREFKELFEDPLFLVKVIYCKTIFPCTSMGASLTENAQTDEQLAKAREDVYTFLIQGTIQHRVSTLSPTESRTPSSAQVYVFDSDNYAMLYYGWLE